MDSKRGLTLDCPTRWNSTYEMVSEALIYKDRDLDVEMNIQYISLVLKSERKRKW
jgi:hypothetical protein